MWRNAVDALNKAIGDRKWLITVVLFGFILIKVIVIARGNIQTALAVFNSAGTATVIVGGILSAFPLVAAIVFGLVIFRLARTFPLKRAFSRQGCRAIIAWVRNRTVNEKATWLAGVIAAVGCFFLTPWPIMAGSAVLGSAWGLVAKINTRAAVEAIPITREKRGNWSKRAVVKAVLFFILVLSSVYFVLYPLLYAVWLPHEELAVPPDEKLAVLQRACPRDDKYVVGYVLSDSNGWISLLLTGQRTICRLKSEEVTARILCQGQVIPMPAPSWLQWYKKGNSLEKEIPDAATTLPACSSTKSPRTVRAPYTPDR